MINTLLRTAYSTEKGIQDLENADGCLSVSFGNDLYVNGNSRIHVLGMAMSSPILSFRATQWYSCAEMATNVGPRKLPGKGPLVPLPCVKPRWPQWTCAHYLNGCRTEETHVSLHGPGAGLRISLCHHSYPFLSQSSLPPSAAISYMSIGVDPFQNRDLIYVAL